MTKQRPSDVLFLSTPRTLSNLLVKMLSQQPGWDESGYYLHDAYVWGLGKMSVSPDMEVGEDVRAELLEKLQAGIDAMVAAREKAHKDVRPTTSFFFFFPSYFLFLFFEFVS